MELYYTSATDWQQKIVSGTVKPEELLAIYQQRIEAVEPKIKGFVTYFEPPVQGNLVSKGSLPGYGIPLALKDNICLAGHPTTCSSRLLGNFVPPYNATVTEKILHSGIPVLGKANMDEFGMGSSNENSTFHLTYNPWDLTRVPGGSSGGPAALVAAGEIPWALGSDTGGSIRLPASFCGIVGMKPTYGLVSRYGLVAYASSLDQIGPLTLTVRDSAMLLNLLAFQDPKDSTSVAGPGIDYTRSLHKGIKGLKIGLPREMFGPGIDEDVRSAVQAAIQQLETLGAEIEETSLTYSEYALAAYYLIATSEASSNLARYDGIRYGVRAENPKNLDEVYTLSRSQGFGTEVKRRIMLGTYALSSGYYEAYYKKAQQVRTLLIEDFKKAFSRYDVLVAPTSPVTAFKIGEKTSDPLSMYLTDLLTISVNLAGIPAISLPCGFDRNHLPIGLQIMGQPLQEELIYQVAQAYEQSTEWHKQHPTL